MGIVSLTTFNATAENAVKPYWQDVQVVAVNKEYPRTVFMTYDNRDDALSGKFERSKYYRLLNGTWKFFFVDSYKKLPDNITDPNISTESWDDIQVPGNWEVQGHGTAIYTNHGYEFKPRNPQPPTLPEANPVGVYRRNIDIPSNWDGRDIYLHLAGVKSGVYVYINGQEVGYSEDSKNPAEFLINKYVKPGKNVLTLKIFRWSTGSYLECEDKACAPLHDTQSYDGCLVSVGGGKDSVVSLEVLKGEKITTYSINGNATTKNVIAVCDHKQGDYAAKRILDKKILELNAEGYLNGHIPFSAVVAFSSFISAFLSGNRYIVLSNETSANETTVKDSFVNHQYSKSFEFEQDFVSYIKKVTDSDIHYFSLLRPLTEMQIAWLFSKCKSYHEVFRSCNAGSKQGIWCCNCPKCLFVYIILTPFLSQEELVHIFGENLLEKDSLDLDFRELTGIEENKPFECVGTRREVLVALKTFIARGGKSLLTERYKETIEAAPGELDEMLSEWVSENQVPEHFLEILKDFMNRA